jgi:hypothetical protein
MCHVLSGSCGAAGLTAASLGAVVPAGGVPGLPLPVVLVDEGLLLAMRERLRAMAAAVTTAQKEAQYQVWHWYDHTVIVSVEDQHSVRNVGSQQCSDWQLHRLQCAHRPPVVDTAAATAAPT